MTSSNIIPRSNGTMPKRMTESKAIRRIWNETDRLSRKANDSLHVCSYKKPNPRPSSKSFFLFFGHILVLKVS